MWTLAELTALAADALATDRPAQANGRVRDVPNERMIRWYVTIGLVDPPPIRRGRIALYGRRHLLQLVAVKRRQAAGRTLAEIQAELAGATDEMLEEISGLPDHASGDEAAGAAAPERFWTRRPAVAGESRPGGRPQARRTELMQGIRLASGVTLLLAGNALGPADLAEIETAARPLLDVLSRLSERNDQ